MFDLNSYLLGLTAIIAPVTIVWLFSLVKRDVSIVAEVSLLERDIGERRTLAISHAPALFFHARRKNSDQSYSRVITMANMNVIVRGLAAGVFCLFAASAAATQMAREGEELLFRVLLNNKEIGFHRFKVEAKAERQTVDINADFDVTFFAIPVYSYDHRNREIWNNGCLEKIASFTDDNGDEYAVNGEHNGDTFEVTTRNDQLRLESSCVMTFAYWNKDFLRQTRLLNAQTGEYLPVEINFKGIEQLQLGSEKVPARRYNLRNEQQGIDISVWYDASSSQWLSLESRVNGRVIRYLPAEYEIAASFVQPLASEK